jgi:hypothetical protein
MRIPAIESRANTCLTDLPPSATFGSHEDMALHQRLLKEKTQPFKALSMNKKVARSTPFRM